jgi:MFS family permease
VAALVGRPLVSALYRADRSAAIVVSGCALSAIAYVAVARSSTALLLAGLLGAHGVGLALSTTGGMAAIMDVSGGRKPGSLMGFYTGAIGAGYAVAAFVGGITGDVLGTTRAITLMAALPVLAGLLLGGILHVALGRKAFPINPEAAPDEMHSPERRSGDGELADPEPDRLAPDGDVAAAEASPVAPAPAPDDPDGPVPLHPLARLKRLVEAPPLVWVAFAVALHINLLNAVLTTYFPLYGLGIGLSLTRIGVLLGLHSVVGATVRFLAPAIFRHVSPRQVLPSLVGLGGVSVAVMTVWTSFAALATVWMLIGLARGVLRVSSAALVMEATNADSGTRGVGSGIYLAGLDIGKIVGPICGGLLVQSWGYDVAFLATGLGFPLVYVALSRRMSARERAVAAADGAS